MKRQKGLINFAVTVAFGLGFLVWVFAVIGFVNVVEALIGA